MRMIPDQLDPATKSNAEKQLFRQLARIEDPRWTFALHSLNLSVHTWNRVGEIDFLLVGPAGIFVIEVKGGRVDGERGVWRYTDRFGNTRKRSSPFKQAHSAMFSLQERLESLLDKQVIDRTVFGYGVAFPDIVFDARTVEWSDEMVIDKRQLARPDGLLRSLNRLASWWRDKPGSRRRSLTEADIAQLLSVLRPDFDVVPTLGRVTAAAELELASLTDAQYRSLDAHTRNPRIIYEGGAGTGKTMLAVELCRRSVQRSEQVLFTCHSPVLAGHVASQPGMDTVRVVPFDRLPARPEERIDTLVVDEAQDLINTESLARFENLLEGGLNDGRWMFFLDSNSQRGLVGTFDPEAMEYLRLARPAELELADNCRNTATVVQSVQLATGADVGVSTAGTGPAVSWSFAADRAAGAAWVQTELERLEEQDVPAGKIMLLSTLPLRESVFSALPGRWRQRIVGLDLESWYDRAPTRLGFAMVREFKGLESPFIILGDVGLGDPEGARAALYVGMTRARIGLSVVLPASDESVLRRLEADHVAG